MADNTSYIGVAMGLDVTDLKSGLAEASKRIGEANADFKAASSSMEDWTKSTEGLQAKIKQLDSILAAQKSKLAGLKAEYEKVAKEQGENSTAARNLYIRMQNQQAVVNQTQREFDNYSDTLKQAEKGTIDLTEVTLKNGKAIKQQGEAAAESVSKLEGLKSVAGGVAKGMAAIGTAAVASVGSFLSLAESTREFREDTAKLNSAFEAAQLSAESASDTYKTLFGAIGESDTAVEASQQIALLANSEEEVAKWADLATGVVGTFGDALKAETFFEAANETIKLGEATGAFTQMLEGTGYSVDKFNAGLAACTTESEKQAYMLQISEQQLGAAGTAYNETAKSIIEAREAEAAMTQAMAELGAIAEPIMTTLKLLAVDLLGAMKPFIQLMGEGLQGVLNGTAGATTALADGIGGILNMLVERVTTLLPTILGVAVQIIPTIADSLLSALPDLISTLFELVNAVLGMLSKVLPQILEKVVELLPMIINSVVEAIPQLLKAAIELLMAIVKAIPTIVKNLVKELPNIIDTIIDTVLEAFPMLIDAAVDLFMAIVEAIPTIIKALVEALPKIINTIIDGVLNALPKLLEAAITLFSAIVKALPTIIKLLVSEVPKIATTIISTLLTKLPDIIAAAFKLLMGIIAAVPKIVTEIIKGMPQIISAIVTGLTSRIGDIKDAGLNVVKGIWSGIKGGAGWLKNKISGFAGDVASWFKSTFKIKSPSKLIEEEVGVYVGQGVIPTSASALSKVKKRLNEFTGFVSDNLGGIKGNLALATTGGGYTAGGVYRQGGNVAIDARQTINYNGSLSRKQIMQQRNDNYVAVEMYLKGKGAI